MSACAISVTRPTVSRNGIARPCARRACETYSSPHDLLVERNLGLRGGNLGEKRGEGFDKVEEAHYDSVCQPLITHTSTEASKSARSRDAHTAAHLGKCSGVRPRYNSLDGGACTSSSLSGRKIKRVRRAACVEVEGVVCKYESMAKSANWRGVDGVRVFIICGDEACCELSSPVRR